MGKKNDLTAQAIEGWNAADLPGAKCPYLYSSASAIAWHAGAWLQRTSRTMPRNVRMGRGYHVHANDMLLQWRDNNEISRVN